MKRNLFPISCVGLPPLSDFLWISHLSEWRGLLRKHSCPCADSLTPFPTDVSVRTRCVHQIESFLYSSRYLGRASPESSRRQRLSESLVGFQNSQLTSAALLITTTVRSHRKNKDSFTEENSQCLPAYTQTHRRAVQKLISAAYTFSPSITVHKVLD